MKLRAITSFPFGDRVLQYGDAFETDEVTGQNYINFKAAVSVDFPETNVAPKKPEHVPPTTVVTITTPVEETPKTVNEMTREELENTLKGLNIEFKPEDNDNYLRKLIKQSTPKE